LLKNYILESNSPLRHLQHVEDDGVQLGSSGRSLAGTGQRCSERAAARGEASSGVAASQRLAAGGCCQGQDKARGIPASRAVPAQPGPDHARADLNGPRPGTAVTAGRAVPARGLGVRPEHGTRPLNRAGPARRAGPCYSVRGKARSLPSQS
jgi:hypothetical protein